MADITKCKDNDCPVKDECHRYTAPATSKWQSYFLDSPRVGDLCEYFWRDTNIKLKEEV